MNQLPESLRQLMKTEFLNQQQDGMRLGIKYAAKTLRDLAADLKSDPAFPPDYLRGMIDSATIIEDFAGKIPENQTHE